LVAFKDHWGATRYPLDYWRHPGRRTALASVERSSAAVARRLLAPSRQIGCSPGLEGSYTAFSGSAEMPWAVVIPRRRFSVVITCYNQREFIRDAVQSALSQTFAGSEIIIVDDGSTDGSAEILKQYEPDTKVVLLPENLGAIAARNYGASQANGEFIVFLDGDDALMSWALNVYERIICERNPTLILATMIRCEGSIPRPRDDDEPRKIELVDYESPMLKDRPVGLSASSFIVRRQAFHNVGGWTPGIFHLDLQDIVMKLGYAGRLTLICKPPTAFYRIHSANTIHRAPPFIHAVSRIVEKERAGQYPGGGNHRLERSAFLGGLIFFWIKRALHAGLYADAGKLAAWGWPMIIVGVARRCAAWIRGRRPVETIEFAHGVREPRHG
jgi:glycosyltransferase involved in cell wall biosynthesis